MRFLDFFIIIMTWFTLFGCYLEIRLRMLRNFYKSSNRDSFLDFFEFDYLGKKEKTWRRKYNFIYNSKIYFILTRVGVFMSFGIVVICIIGLVIIHSYGFWELMLEPLK